MRRPFTVLTLSGPYSPVSPPRREFTASMQAPEWTVWIEWSPAPAIKGGPAFAFRSSLSFPGEKVPEDGADLFQ